MTGIPVLIIRQHICVVCRTKIFLSFSTFSPTASAAFAAVVVFMLSPTHLPPEAGSGALWAKQGTRQLLLIWVGLQRESPFTARQTILCLSLRMNKNPIHFQVTFSHLTTTVEAILGKSNKPKMAEHSSRGPDDIVQSTTNS